MLPHFISNSADFARRVTLGHTLETLVLDFKSAQNGWTAPKHDVRREAQKELCRDVAQFANTFGGVLLIGVKEVQAATAGQRVAGSVTPVTDVEALKAWIEQAIKNFLVPSTLTHQIIPVETAHGMTLVVNVPASRYLVALWDREAHTIEYLYRTNHGKDWFNPDEAEAHIMNGSRAGRIALAAAIGQADRADTIANLADGIHERGTGGRVKYSLGATVGALHEHTFIININTNRGTPIALHVPYGLIDEVWSDGKEVHLLLRARVMIEKSDRATLIPF